jgi:hypothetical protein
VCEGVRRLFSIMEGTRRWFVESKGFEMLIRGGALGVRFVEKSKNKRRSLFIQRDELVWLVKAVEVAVDRETSEVFWDQSRAGYSRLIVQKCSNKHGRFLTIEEFDGRRRIGIIIIPEGRYGQGWSRLVTELHMLSLSLWKRCEIREKKPENVVSARRSYAAVVGMSKPPEVELARQCGGVSENHIQTETTRNIVKPGEGNQLADGSSGKLEGTPAVNQSVQAVQITDNCTVGEGVKCSALKDSSMGREQGAFNTMQELSSCRAWLVSLKGEIEAGLRRCDAVIKKLESSGPGQGDCALGGPLEAIRKEPKGKGKLKPGGSGLGSSGGPKFFKPKVSSKKPVATGEGPSAGLGLLVRPKNLAPLGPGGGCLDPSRKAADGSGSSATQGTKKRTREPLPVPGSGNLSHAKSTPEGMRGELGLTAGLSAGEGLQDAFGDDGLRGGPECSTSPMKCTRTPLRHQSVNAGTSVAGGKNALPRPELSWVAGRTGFGPCIAGKDTILSVDSSAADSVVEATLAGSSLICGSVDSEVPDVVVSGDGQVESYVEDSAEDSGHASLAQIPMGDGEVEASPVSKILRNTVEVGSIIGLTSNGQEGRKLDCLRKIIVEQLGTEGCCHNSVDQHGEESSAQERGNCSDYEA